MTLRQSLDWRKWALWILWPGIAAVLLIGVAVFVVLAWFMIPFGQMVRVENGDWGLRFPWID